MDKRPKLTLLRCNITKADLADSANLKPLLNLHIPKCAGTTLDVILFGLAKMKGRSFFRIPGTIYQQKFAGKAKNEASENLKSLAIPDDWLCASGHIPFGVFPYDASSVNQIAIIREPLSRLSSMFRMGVRRGVWSATTPVQQLFDSGFLAEDSIVRQLAGVTSRVTRLTGEDVEIALRNYESIKYKGTLADFEDVVGSILSDYGVEYLAYHRFQTGDELRDLDGLRLEREFEPYMRLDQIFFDRARNDFRLESKRCMQVNVDDVPPKIKVLLVTPYLYSNGQQIRSIFLDIEAIRKIFG